MTTDRKPKPPSPRVEVFTDLAADEDVTILARAHHEVSDWARDRTREEVIAMLVEVRADYLRALRDLKAALRRLREFEAERAGRARGGRGNTRADAKARAAARAMAERMMLAWLKERWKRGLMLWSEITREDRAELFDTIHARLPASIEVDDRTLHAWLKRLFETTNRADWGMPGEP
jgi:hypothetical protein